MFKCVSVLCVCMCAEREWEKESVLSIENKGNLVGKIFFFLSFFHYLLLIIFVCFVSVLCGFWVIGCKEITDMAKRYGTVMR